MKHPIPFFSHSVSFFILVGSAVAHAAAPAVSNLGASQRAGTNLVDITYDVAADTPTVAVTLRISSDGGVTYGILASSVSGDIGANVAVGAGKSITWNAEVDWYGQASQQVRFLVTADDGTPGVTPTGYALIPAGAFTMGDALDGNTDAPQHQVQLSNFFMGLKEVTFAEWSEVRDWGIANGYSDLPVAYGKGSNHPVAYMNWYQALKWCNARSEKDGLFPCYVANGNVYRTGTNSMVWCDWAADGYRLPTEAEWEKAARGGLSGKRFPWGDTINHDFANYVANGSAYTYDTSPYTISTHHPDFYDGATPYTSPVGSFAPNGYGLYDMTGNVFEWCWDWYYYTSYQSSWGTDPRGPVWGSDKVNRGGYWGINAFGCRVAYRSHYTPNTQNGTLGFRTARKLTPDAASSGITGDVVVDTRSWTLSSPDDPHGSVDGAGVYPSNTIATLTATPDLGYVFVAWSGDASGADNPLEILMDSDKLVTAIFNEDLSDADSDGLSAYLELTVYGTNPSLADTDQDGLNDGDEVQVHGSNPLLKDSDGDGFEDLFEVNAGFDPTSDTSTPEAATSIRTAVEFRFNAANGVSYRIEASTDLDQWITVETDIIGEGGVVTRFYSTENQPTRYFRVSRN